LKNKFITILIQLFIVNCQLSIAFAQDIPIGTWRTHISFNAIHAVASTASTTYAAADNGVMVFNKADNSISTLTKLQGLGSSTITAIEVDVARQQLLIAYTDGVLDIIKPNEVITFNRLKNSTTISGSKKINHIFVRGTMAYLSTDYGVVIFDLTQLEVKETYRDLGVAGTALKILESTFMGDSIFLATEQGVIAGDLDDNLLDFSNWKRFNTGAFNGNIKSITLFNNQVYAAVDNSGIYQYNSGSWQLQSYLQNLIYLSMKGNNNLIIVEESNIWQISPSNTLTPIATDKISTPLVAIEDNEGNMWIGDNHYGLVSNISGSFEQYLPNAPSFSNSHRLKYAQNLLYNNKGVLHAVSGGFDVNYTPLQNEASLNYFMDGVWMTQPSFPNLNLTDVDFIATKIYIASYDYGLHVIHESFGQDFYNHTNSTLVNNRITAVEASKAGLWVAEYGVAKPLHLFNPVDNSWQSFSIPYQYPTEIKTDYLGQVWMINNPSLGGGLVVYKKETNQVAYLTEASGKGALPSRSVFSIAMDHDGQVWVGTAAGVAYFPDPSRVFSPGLNSVKPIFGNRNLLSDERVISMEVDGGNRKWMGTERGVWLFDPFGETQVYNFNIDNSPLISNRVADIEINQQSGEVFFLSSNGIVSFRADATASEYRFDKVKIFPNPVTSRFNGLVGISGLSTNATVKITDVSGKLIWQTYANGGTATWNVRDYNGNRAATGIYLVLAVSVDGSESVVGKIAVVN
jgi:hypothetical protein